MSSFIPKKNSTYDLGSDKYYWKDLYVTDIIRIKEPVKYYQSRRKTPVFRHGDIRRIRRKTDVPTVFA